MANDVIPVDADKWLFTHDVVNHVFRDKPEVHVHHEAADFREFIHVAFNSTMEDAVEFIEELLEPEIDKIYNRLKRTASVNEEAYARHAEELIEKSFPHGFDAKNFLDVSVQLAMLAENFYSDGLTDAPDLAVKFIHRSFKDVDMTKGGWVCLNLIAENIQSASLISPSPESDVEPHIPDPRTVRRQLFRPVNFNGNDDLSRERINELRLQALRGYNRVSVNYDSASEEAPLENENESHLNNSRMFPNQSSRLREIPLKNIKESDLRTLPGGSVKRKFSNRSSSEKEVPPENVSKSNSNFLPGGSGNNRMFTNQSSPLKESPFKNINESEFLPGNSRNNRIFANHSSGNEVPRGSVNEPALQFLPGNSGNNSMFANRSSSDEEVSPSKWNVDSVGKM